MVAARPRLSLADELQQIVQRIVETYAPDKIILFGSHAYGQPGPDSDYDLLIIRDSTARPIDRRVEVGLALLPVLKETPVEPLVLTPAELTDRLKIGDPFFREIIAKGKVLYERGRVNHPRRMVRNRRARPRRVPSAARR